MIVKKSQEAFCIEEQNKNVSEDSHARRTHISSIREKKGKLVEENTTFSLEKDNAESKPVENNKPLAVVSGSKKDCYVKKEQNVPEDQVAMSYCRSDMRKFKACFNIPNGESPKTLEPKLESRKKNVTLH